MSFGLASGEENAGERIKDIIRVANTDISNVLCMQNGGKVFMKESTVVDLAEENQISNIDFLCKFIMETKISEDSNAYYSEDASTHQYALIRDVETPGLVVESYHPQLGEDYFLAKFNLMEAYMPFEQDIKKPEDLPEGEEPIDEYGIETNSMGSSFFGIPVGKIREMINMLMIRLLGFFRSDKYSNKRQIDDRIALCKNAIKDCDVEITRVEHDDPSKMYTAQEIMASLIRLGLQSAIAIAGSSIIGGVIGGVINSGVQSRIIKELIHSAVCIYSAANYKNFLQGYKKNLNKTLDYLQMKSDKEADKENGLKEKSKANRLKLQTAAAMISESSINDIV